MAVFLARIVIPRSRSCASESIARSWTCWLARKVPANLNIESTSVVLPWSTWATMAMLRMGFLCCMRGEQDTGRRAGRQCRPPGAARLRDQRLEVRQRAQDVQVGVARQLGLDEVPARG